jgi:hypothetical protein
MKDGSVIECKIVKENVVKNNQQHFLIEDEKKAQREIPVDQIAAIFRGKPSWEVRADNLAWYEKESAKDRETWSKQFAFAKDCKRRQLDSQAVTHFEKAYELRKPEIKTAADREKLAKWLEKDCGLFDAAQTEYLAVYEEKKTTVAATPSDRFNLGKWCESKALYIEADTEYQEALKLDANYASAQRALERLKQLRETLVHPALYRSVKEQLIDGSGYYSKKILKDGSYGSDVSEAGVQGLRAMTALCGMGMIAQWEFEGVDKPDVLKTLPKEIDQALEFILGAPEQKKALRGPDVWGAIYSIEFLAKLLDKDALKTKREAIRAKLKACIDGLSRMQVQDGGWAYYDKNLGRPNSFVTAPAILALTMAKKQGIDIPKDMIERAAKSLLAQRQSDGVFMYKSGARQSPEGSCARAPLCELALLLTGNSTKEKVQGAVDSFFKYRHILEKIKGQKGTHIGSGATAPYYFLMGHLYTARAIKALDKNVQGAYLTKLRDIMFGCQESDNSWWDTPLEKDNKIYGTALGVLTLYHLATLGSDADTRPAAKK